jgi:nucleotide-binding universal stress UspA family protein
MVQIKRILCPTDMSEFSAHALEHAAALAAWHEAELTVLHVYAAVTPPVAVTGFPGDVPMLPPKQPDEVAAEVRQFCDETRVPPGIANVVVRHGHAARVIPEHAREMQADLLVMGTHGRSGFERLLLGSVTEKVMRSTDVPVLTVPPPAGTPGAVRYTRILCPVAFTEESAAALDYALLLAEEADAQLVLLHVVEPFPEQLQAASIAHLDAEDRARLVEHTSRLLAAAIPEEARTWCKPTVRVAFGKATREILRVATELPADLIVLGVGGRGAIDRWIFGSTSPRIVREAACPVLTVRA